MRRYIPSEISGDIGISQSFETPETKQAQLNHELSKFGAPYNPELTIEQNHRRLAILQRMEESGMISFSEAGDLLFDSQNPTAFQEYDKNQQKAYQTPEVVEALSGVSGYERVAYNQGSREKREIVALPQSAQEMTGDWQPENGLVSVLDLDKTRFRKWNDQIKLSSGESVSLFELSISRQLKSLQAERDPQGILRILDPKTNQPRKFSVEAFGKILQNKAGYSFTQNGQKFGLRVHPQEFLEMIGQNLIRMGAIRPSDIRRMTKSTEPKPRLDKKTPEDLEQYTNDLKQQFRRFGVDYDASASLEENRQKFQDLRTLEASGIIEIKDGSMFFDAAGFSKYQGEQWRNVNRRVFSPQEAVDFFQGMRAYKKVSDPKEQERIIAQGPQAILALPKNAREISSEYASQAKDSLLKLWDLRERIKWGDPIAMESGETTNTFELFFVSKLFDDLQARRNSQGVMEITDPKTGERKPFTIQRFVDILGIKPGVTPKPGERPIGMDKSPLEFLAKYGQNLFKNGIIKRDEIRVLGSSATAEWYLSEKRVGAKTPFVSITTPGTKHHVRYYMGRDKLVGTDIPRDEHISIVVLDNKTAGVMERRDGKERILFTIDLIGSEEIMQRRQSLREKWGNRGKTARETEVSAGVSVNAQEVQNRMKEYRITSYVSKRPEETAEAYAERISKLSDAQFVIKTFREFFSEIEIGVHQLPWGEQLILANAILEARDPKKLKDFALKFGMQGLRTFLACDYDPKMAGVVLGLGEKNSESAKVIFEKYNQIINATEEVEDFIKKTFTDSVIGSVVKAKETLLRRAKDLLASYKDRVGKGVTIDVELVSQELDNIKVEILLFASGFKAAAENGRIDFRKIPGVEFTIRDSKNISPQDKAEMERIFIANRQGYSPQLLKETVGEFETALNSSGKEFFVLKYAGETVSFIRFDQLANGNLYAGSLNVRPEVRGSSIGSAMLHQTLDKKAEAHDIEAVVYGKNPMLRHYTSDFGFQIVGEIPDYHGTGQLFYKLFRPRSESIEKAA
jgi:ribosomal protein S18 acetylase RimI-like enzyme